MKTLKHNLFILLLAKISPPINVLAADGEPVPGAEIYVEFEPGDEPIANIVTNNDGEFEFCLPAEISIPKNGVFSITIIPPKKLKDSKIKNLRGMKKATINISFKEKDGSKFKYVLIWKTDQKVQNKGCFAVSGKNDT